MNVHRVNDLIMLIFDDGSGVVVDSTGKYHPADYIIDDDHELQFIEPGTWIRAMAITLTGAYDNMCE